MAPIWPSVIQTLFVDFYQRLAREIHARHMKLYVEHFVNIRSNPMCRLAHTLIKRQTPGKTCQMIPKAGKSFSGFWRRKSR